MARGARPRRDLMQLETLIGASPSASCCKRRNSEGPSSRAPSLRRSSSSTSEARGLLGPPLPAGAAGRRHSSAEDAVHAKTLTAPPAAKRRGLSLCVPGQSASRSQLVIPEQLEPDGEDVDDLPRRHSSGCGDELRPPEPPELHRRHSDGELPRQSASPGASPRAGRPRTRPPPLARSTELDGDDASDGDPADDDSESHHSARSGTAGTTPASPIRITM